jgi:hypothetical protein
MLATLATSVAAQISCPTATSETGQWSRNRNGDKCWAVLEDACSFECCVQRCGALGASTPCVQDTQDNRDLTGLAGSRPWWVGMYQSPARDSRTLFGWNQWGAQNCSSNFHDFGIHEPNDWDCLQENCVVANRPYSSYGNARSRYRWLDEPCNRIRHCVCEWPGAPSSNVLQDGPTLTREAGRPLPRSSGCLLRQRLLLGACRCPPLARTQA